MIKKIKLYLDFDGVILDTMNVTKKMMEDLNISDNQEVIREFYKNINWYKLLRSTPEINDSFNNINLLLNSGLYDIEILTHVNSKEEGIEKINYLSNIIPNVNVIPTPIEIAKCNMVNSLNSVLVDDYSKNLILWKNKDGIPIKFSDEIDSRFITINNLKKLLELYEILNAKINLKRKLLLRTYR